MYLTDGVVQATCTKCFYCLAEQSSVLLETEPFIKNLALSQNKKKNGTLTQTNSAAETVCDL